MAPVPSWAMARAYDVVEVEKKWQRRWADEGTYEVDADDPRPPWYVLTMYPYPSGPAHMGHVRNYTFGDLLVRHRTMLGYAVLSPFGFDSFGLPAENAAIKTGTHPRIFTDARIAELKESIISLGAVYDWRREIRSHDPDLHQVEPGHLPASSWTPAWPTGPTPRSTGARAARPCWPTSRSCPTAPASAPATWSSSGTWSSGSSASPTTPTSCWPTWTTLDWPERVKTMQRNWIGRSEGAEFDLPVVGRDGSRRRAAAGPAGVHHPAGHLVRHDLRRGRPRAPPGRRAHHRRAPRRGRRRSRAGPRPAPSRAHCPRAGAASLAKRGAFTGSSVRQPVHRPAGARLRGRLRAHGLRHRRHHGRARPRTPGTGTSPRPTACPYVRTVQPPDGWDEHGGPDGGPGGATPARARRSTASG